MPLIDVILLPLTLPIIYTLPVFATIFSFFLHFCYNWHPCPHLQLSLPPSESLTSSSLLDHPHQHPGMFQQLSSYKKTPDPYIICQFLFILILDKLNKLTFYTCCLCFFTPHSLFNLHQRGFCQQPAKAALVKVTSDLLVAKILKQIVFHPSPIWPLSSIQHSWLF